MTTHTSGGQTTFCGQKNEKEQKAFFRWGCKNILGHYSKKLNTGRCKFYVSPPISLKTSVVFSHLSFPSSSLRGFLASGFPLITPIMGYLVSLYRMYFYIYNVCNVYIIDTQQRRYSPVGKAAWCPSVWRVRHITPSSCTGLNFFFEQKYWTHTHTHTCIAIVFLDKILLQYLYDNTQRAFSLFFCLQNRLQDMFWLRSARWTRLNWLFPYFFDRNLDQNKFSVTAVAFDFDVEVNVQLLRKCCCFVVALCCFVSYPGVF